jgi:integrase
MPQLTKAVVDRNLPKEKVYMVWDDTIKGFGLKIYPSKKTFVYFYRSPQTRKQTYLKIGVYGSVTVDEARIQAKKYAHSVQIEKIDPKDSKKAKEEKKKQFLSFEEFWKIFTEKYIKENHKPSTIKGNASRIKKYILPFFGRKPLAEITRRDILDFQESMNHAKGNCTKCLRLLNTAFNQAELWQYIPKNTNPCEGVPKHPEKKMERFLSVEELERLEKTLLERENVGIVSSQTIDAFRLIIYTGCRLGEVLSLQWENVDFKDCCLRLKDSKTGKRTIPLNESAIDILKKVQKQEGNPYVFCGKKRGRHLVSVQATWRRLRHKAGLPDVRIHDLRHSFASFMIKNDVSLFHVSKLLGHSDIKTTMRYAHLTNKELVDVANKGGEIFKKRKVG